MCITITVGERGRRVMGLLTTVINVVLVFLSLALFALAVAIRYKIDDKLELLEGYDSGSLSYYLMVIAGIMFFCHLVAVNFCYNAAYLETRSSEHHTFVTLIFVVIGMFVLVVISQIVLAVHTSKLRSALHDGIYMSMKTYSTQLNNKVKIDKLQMEFECCGSETLREWFEIPWARAMYVNVESSEVKPFLKDGEFIKDDAPFSCCNKYSRRACVHHSVHNAAAHRNYEGHTLYKVGCVDVLMDNFSGEVLTPTALLLLAVLILQAIDVAVMRLLQTSIFEAEEMNDPEGASTAYCIKGVGGGGDVRSYLKRKPDKKSKAASDEDESEPEEDESESETGGGTDDTEDEDKDDDTAADDDDDDHDRSGGAFDSGDFGSFGSGGGGGGGGRGGDYDSGGSEPASSRDDDDDRGDSSDHKKSKEEKKREKKEKKEEKKQRKQEEKEEKKKKKEEKKQKKLEEKEEKKKKKEEKKKGKKEKKEEKKAKKKEKKDQKKQKKLEKKQKDKEKKAKKKADKDKKKLEKKEKNAKKKAEKKRKQQAKKEAKARKKAEQKRKKQAKKEAKAKKKAEKKKMKKEKKAKKKKK